MYIVFKTRYSGNITLCKYVLHLSFTQAVTHRICIELQSHIGRAPVAQSVAMQAVNPGVVSLNPSMANLLLDVCVIRLSPMG